MVAQLLRLRVRLLANILRRSPVQIVGMVIGLLYCIGATALAVAALLFLRAAETQLAADIVITGGALVVLGFLLLPLAFGADDTLDPRAFSLYGLSTTRLAGGLALSAFVGIPAIAITVVAVAQVVTWAGNPLAVVLGVLGAVVIVATCVLGARVSTSVAAFWLATRRARETTTLITLVLIVAASPLVLLLGTTDWPSDGSGILRSIADVVRWTPLGAAWAAPADAALGEVGPALAEAAIGVAFVALLWLGWRALVGWMLVAPHREERRRRHPGLGWFDRMPRTQAGAIAARSITYWIRDARYHTSLVAIPFAPLIFIVALAVGGVEWNILALIPVPVICLFLSWSVHNDVAYDNSAVWLHVASGASGRADRLGRLVPALVLGVLVVAIGSPICAYLYGEWAVLPPLLGVSSCLLFAGLGLSSLISARFPYPAVRPGDNPFAQPQAPGSSAGLIQSLSFVATLLIAVPPAALAALWFLFGGDFAVWSLVVGLVVGLAVLIFGVRRGGTLFTRRAPELLAFTLRN